MRIKDAEYDDGVVFFDGKMDSILKGVDVKDNITNEVIQISNRLDPGWVPDATIVNPYKP